MWELVAFVWMPRQTSGAARNRFKHLVARGRGELFLPSSTKKSMIQSPKQEYRVHRYGWACLSHKPGSVLNCPAGPALGGVNVGNIIEILQCWELRSPLRASGKGLAVMLELTGNGDLCACSVKPVGFLPCSLESVIPSSSSSFELYIRQMLLFLKALALLVPVLLSYLVPESSVLTSLGSVELDLLSSSQEIHLLVNSALCMIIAFLYTSELQYLIPCKA